jgi:hypothetical protein
LWRTPTQDWRSCRLRHNAAQVDIYNLQTKQKVEREQHCYFLCSRSKVRQISDLETHKAICNKALALKDPTIEMMRVAKGEENAFALAQQFP